MAISSQRGSVDISLMLGFLANPSHQWCVLERPNTPFFWLRTLQMNWVFFFFCTSNASKIKLLGSEALWEKWGISTANKGQNEKGNGNTEGPPRSWRATHLPGDANRISSECPKITDQHRLSCFKGEIQATWGTTHQTRKKWEHGARGRVLPRLLMTVHLGFKIAPIAVHATVLCVPRDCLEAELMMYCDKIRSRSTRTQISRRTLDEGSRCVWLMDWQRTAEQKREMCSTFASTDGLTGDLHTHPLIHPMTHAFHMM